MFIEDIVDRPDIDVSSFIKEIKRGYLDTKDLKISQEDFERPDVDVSNCIRGGHRRLKYDELRYKHKVFPERIDLYDSDEEIYTRLTTTIMIISVKKMKYHHEHKNSQYKTEYEVYSWSSALKSYLYFTIPVDDTIYIEKRGNNININKAKDILNPLWQVTESTYKKPGVCSCCHDILALKIEYNLDKDLDVIFSRVKSTIKDKNVLGIIKDFII